MAINKYISGGGINPVWAELEMKKCEDNNFVGMYIDSMNTNNVTSKCIGVMNTYVDKINKTVDGIMDENEYLKDQQKILEIENANYKYKLEFLMSHRGDPIEFVLAQKIIKSY